MRLAPERKLEVVNLIDLVFDIATGCLDDYDLALLLANQGAGDGRAY
jgi:hypothetical protein